MAKSRGKKFESEVSKMLSRSPKLAYVHRAPDLMGTHFTLPNPIDFLCFFQGGAGLAAECKSIRTKSLPWRAFTTGRDQNNGDEYGRQWRALERCSDGGVKTFVLVNFYGWPGRDGQRGRVFAASFMWLARWRTEHERKSVPLAAFEAGCEELRKVAGTWEWGLLEP